MMTMAKNARKLDPDEARRFHRIFEIQGQDVDKIQIPELLASKCAAWFGSETAAPSQRVLLLRNVLTGETATFNALRSQKPRPCGDDDAAAVASADGKPAAQQSVRGCDFCDAERFTSSASWGRVRSARGNVCSAANVAAAMAHHGLLILSMHDTFRALRTVPGLTMELLECAESWAMKAAAAAAAAAAARPSSRSARAAAQERDTTVATATATGAVADFRDLGSALPPLKRTRVAGAKDAGAADPKRTDCSGGTAALRSRRLYRPTLFWNVGHKAGASQPHGHAQIVLVKDLGWLGGAGATAGALARACSSWQRDSDGDASGHGAACASGACYFDEFVWCHAVLGLARRRGTAALVAHLVPRKERELIVVGPVQARAESEGGGLHLSEDFKALAHCAVLALVQFSGVRSYNAVCHLPATEGCNACALPEQSPTGPHTTHAIFRIVDRGDPDSKLTDFGSFELYGPTVVGQSPFDAGMMQAIDRALQLFERQEPRVAVT